MCVGTHVSVCVQFDKGGGRSKTSKDVCVCIYIYIPYSANMLILTSSTQPVPLTKAISSFLASMPGLCKKLAALVVLAHLGWLWWWKYTPNKAL